ncbi:hypothetical protein B9Z55_012075 [Caenorhabditis nigoni]|uniref:Uncharacterized protein n=1 Tax=Caenorhabditis nigoni TaxID=1611254 RepID=A0A2G5TVN6_9PELO|nr:hypothetical protein B9Z55_012075 [Caenorhabditis nigoni]
MVGSSMFCVGFLGYLCYSELSSQLSMTSSQSQVANSLQKQLYFALVGQTVIPITFMYLPICVFVFGPVFMVEIGVISTYLTHAVTLYPVLDPLPNMFIIKSYRNTIIDFYHRLKSGTFCRPKNNHIAVETITSVGTTMRQYNGSVCF